MSVSGNSDKLRKLADDVRTLLNEPIEIAADLKSPSDERWQGPTAERVRGGLKTRHGRLQAMADDVEGAIGNASGEDD